MPRALDLDSGHGAVFWGDIYLGKSVLTDYLVCSATAAAANSLCLFFQS